MAAILLPIPWTRQPQSQTNVDWGNPLARELVFLTSVGTAYTKNGTQHLTVSAGSPFIGSGVAGRGPQFSGGQQAYSIPSVATNAAAQGFTLEVLCAVTSVPSLAGFVGTSFVTGAGKARGLICFPNIYFWGGGADIDSGVAWRTDGNIQHVFCVSDGSGQPMRFYRDGGLIATVTTPTLDVSNTTAFIGDANQGWFSTPTGTIFKTSFYNRPLSASEVANLTANPWQVFSPLQRKIFVDVAAGGAYTVTADAGSFALGGQDATILKTRIVTADAGAFTLSGQDATISYLSGYTLTAEAGAFTLGGQDATILKTRIVTGDAGAFTLTGQDASIVYVPAGSYILSAEAGAFTLSGQTASIYKTRIVSADAGAFTLSGQSATFSYSGAPVVTVDVPRQEGIDWATIVYKTLGKDYDKPEYVYEFSNGRRFVDKKNPYA